MHVCQDDLTSQFVYSFVLFCFFFFQPAHSIRSWDIKRKAANRNANCFKIYMEDQDVYSYLDQDNKHELRDESRQATRWNANSF